MSVASYLESLTPKDRNRLLDEMFGHPRKLFEATFNAWAEDDKIEGVTTVTRAVFFGVSAKTPEGARLKILNYFDQIKGEFKPMISEQM